MNRASRALAGVLIALTLSGCGTWRAVAPPAPPAPPSPSVSAGVTAEARQAAPDLGWVRVQLADGRSVQLRHTTIDADSVRGEVISDQRGERAVGHVAFARSDVRALETHHLDARRTGLTFLGLGAGAGVAALITLGSTVRHPIVPAWAVSH